jgi:hypothetical protein
MTFYKAFDATVFPDDSTKLVCSGKYGNVEYRKIYHIGKRHYVKGEPVLCENGMHYSHELAFVYRYRDGDSRICEVIPRGKIVDGDNKSVCSCMDVMREIPQQEVIDSLAHSLENDDDWNVRGSSAEVLGKIGDASVVPALIHAFQHDEDWGVRYVVADALEHIQAKAKSQKEKK